jgi:hypothetical protein
MASTGLVHFKTVHYSPYMSMRQANYFPSAPANAQSFLNLNGLAHLCKKHEPPYVSIRPGNYFAPREKHLEFAQVITKQFDGGQPERAYPTRSTKTHLLCNHAAEKCNHAPK